MVAMRTDYEPKEVLRRSTEGRSEQEHAYSEKQQGLSSSNARKPRIQRGQSGARCEYDPYWG